MDELIYASASALAKAIRTKQVSAFEVVQAHLARIEAAALAVARHLETELGGWLPPLL